MHRTRRRGVLLAGVLSVAVALALTPRSPAEAGGGGIADTVTTVTASPNPAFTDTAVRLSAMTTIVGSAQPAPTGTTTFSEGATVLGSDNGRPAVLDVSTFTPGTHVVTASYTTHDNARPSSAFVTVTVEPATVQTGNSYCNPGGLTITTSVPTFYPSRVVVSGASGTLSKLTLQLQGLTAQEIDGLDLLLVSPSRERFVPLSNRGGTSAIVNATITLDDSAGNILTDSPFTSGTWRPSARSTAITFPAPAPANPAFPSPAGSATFASTFNGISPNGTWSLYAVSATHTAVSLTGWCLGVTTLATSVPTTTTVTASSNPSLVGGNVTFTATVTASGSPATEGSVTFTEGATTLAAGVSVNASGQATFSTSALTEGTHVITATYAGTANFGTSSGTMRQTIDRPTTVTGNQFCNTGPITIPPNGTATPYASRIFVTGLAGTTSKVTLQLNGLSLPSTQDIDVLLVRDGTQTFVPFSHVGGVDVATAATVTLDDDAANALPLSGGVVSATYRPAAYDLNALSFPSPAPAGPYALAPFASDKHFSTVFNGLSPNVTWSLYVVSRTPAGGASARIDGGWCLNITTPQPQLSLTKTHVGDFTAGQSGAVYTITAGNNGPGTVTGTVTVVDSVPAGLTLTGLTGNGWTCTVSSATCTRSDALAANAQYPPITATVDIAANATSPVVNQATVSAPGATSASAADSTVVGNPPDLTIAKTTSSRFVAGGTALYDLVVTNRGTGATTGSITVVDAMPAGLGVRSGAGSAWDCSASTTTVLTCVSTTTLAPGASSTISLGVDIAPIAPTSITNTAMVSGGGEVDTGNNQGSVSVNVSPASLPPQRLYADTVTPPSTIAIGTTWAVETAQRINVSCAGSINGVWWYRTASDTGLNTVTVWKGTTLLGQGASNPSATGWVKVALNSPVSVAAGDQLLIGVHHPNGAYAYRTNGFTNRAVTSGCLTAPASSSTDKNGRYAYSPAATLPTLSYADSEYFISPDFQPGTTPPPPPPPPPSTQRLYAATVTPPSTIAIGSTWAVETAQRINFSCKGTVNGVWWYRTAQDTGVNTVTAWRNGVLLMQGSGDPGGTGWSFLAFAGPIDVAAGDQLLLGVHHPNGAYGYRTNGFTGRSVTSGCLTAPASTSTDKNGRYAYSSAAVLPTLSYADSEYFISPDFREG